MIKLLAAGMDLAGWMLGDGAELSREDLTESTDYRGVASVV